MTAGPLVDRFSIKRIIIAPVGVMAVLAASLAVALPAQASGGDEQAADGEFTAWTSSSFTEWQTDPTPPQDPDSEDGDTNPLNLAKIGEGGPGVYEQEVGGASTTKRTDWVTESPGDGWVQIEEETVSNNDGYDKVVVDEAAHWQRYSWTGGPHRTDDPPAEVPPADNWQANTKSDPHKIGVPGPYFRSHGNKGNGDWFYLAWVPEKSHTIPIKATTHEEFKFEKVIVTQDHTEYRWSIYKRTYTESGDSSPTEDTTVTPLATSTPDDCDEDPFGIIAVTAVEGVTYRLQDGSVISGTVAANGVNTVTAHLDEGHVLADGAVSEWTFVSNPATECEVPDDSEEPTVPEEPAQPNTPSVPTEVKGQTAATAPSQANQPTRSHTLGNTTPAVPLSIDAGL